MYEKDKNPMGVKPVPRLLLSLAVPAVVANLVNALYNIVDQIFIGHRVGYLGNAATNIAFPLTTVCLAIGLMTGLGAASGFNLELGKGEPQNSRRYAGTAFSFLLISGAVICLIVRLFLKPIMLAFGATEDILSYAMEYSGITSLGIPFLLFSVGASPLIRGDGNARYSMMSVVVGAVVNVVLDAWFMYGLDLGIAGAAWATIIGQFVSACVVALYFTRFRNVKFSASDFIPRPSFIFRVCKLGLASFVFQSSMVLVQVTANNLLKIYGAQSVYGSDVAIAVAGILVKINSIFIAVIIGIVQGSQPICSFNYGAKKYTRVRETVRLLIITTTVLSTALYLVIQLFPKQMIGMFGEGSAAYFEFSVKYARAFTGCMFINGVQIAASTFFPSIGKPGKGTVISLSKQLLFTLPSLFIFSRLWGLNGLMVATPVADALSFALAASLLFFEMKKMPREDG